MHKRGVIMILCFGTFVSVLSYYTQGQPDVKFVPRVAWVVDTKNSSLGKGLTSNVSEDELDGMEGNPEVVCRLLSCKRPLVLRDKQLPSLAVARARFKSKVMPFINEEKVAKAVLAVRHIISLDDTIKNERKETFRKYLGMYRDAFLQQTIFDVPDFFARVLLYTTCIDNNEGRPYVKEITDSFIEEIANDDWADPKWDTVAQTLELIPTGEKRLSDWVDWLCKLRAPMDPGGTEYLLARWIGVKMTDLDPSIYGRTEIRGSDAQKLLLRKINPYAYRGRSDKMVY